MKKIMGLVMAGLLATSVFAGDSIKADAPSGGDSTKANTSSDSVSTKPETTATKEQKDSVETKLITTESGLQYLDLVVGEGKVAENLMKVTCHYTLWLDEGDGKKGKKIQSSKDGAGTPFTCTIGQRLIPGWSEGMIGMKEGGTRELRVPYELGYGERGSPAGIPGKQDLIFEIDFIKAL